MRELCLRIARGRLAACRLDGRSGHRGTRRNTTRGALALDHEIGYVKGLTDDAKAVELEPHLLVHRVAGVSSIWRRPSQRASAMRMAIPCSRHCRPTDSVSARFPSIINTRVMEFLSGFILEPR